MPLTNPVTINGQISGAYREDGFDVEGNGLTSLLTLLQFLLDNTSGASRLADNGLNLDINTIKIGGTLIEETTITNTDQLLKIGQDVVNNKAYIQQDGTGKILVIHHEDATFFNYIAASSTGFAVNLENKTTEISCQLDMSSTEGAFAVSDNGNYLSGIAIEQTQLLAFGIRTYASSAAAQADVTFTVGGIYRLTGDSVLRIKTT